MQPPLRDTPLAVPLATEREPKQTRMSRDLFPRENLLHCGISIRPLSALGHKQTSHPAWTLSALPPKADFERHEWHVRFVPEADIGTVYSITSSAATSSLSGTVRPSILAVPALMTNSNLLDCTTGKSAGLTPLRMRPV